MPPIMSDRAEFSTSSSTQELIRDDGLLSLQKPPPQMMANSHSSNHIPSSHSSSSSSLSVAASGDMHDMQQQSSRSPKTSIVAAMDSFVRAINEMDDTILIPSKLRDMELGAGESGSNSNMALVPQQKSQDDSVATTDQSADMFAFYRTLNAIKTELVNGHSSDEEDDDSDDEKSTTNKENDPSFQAAKAFRHHLQGLFGVLQQLTGTAKFLTSRYQDEIGESTGAASSISAFTL